METHDKLAEGEKMRGKTGKAKAHTGKILWSDGSDSRKTSMGSENEG